jgi:hypothetical protein
LQTKPNQRGGSIKVTQKEERKKKKRRELERLFKFNNKKKDHNNRLPLKLITQQHWSTTMYTTFLKRGSAYATSFGALFRPVFQAFSKLEQVAICRFHF